MKFFACTYRIFYPVLGPTLNRAQNVQNSKKFLKFDNYTIQNKKLAVNSLEIKMFKATSRISLIYNPCMKLSQIGDQLNEK